MGKRVPKTGLDLKHLGKQDNAPTDRLDCVPRPGPVGALEVTLECTEFTSHCPVTGQPDFATLSIRYGPGEYLVETKSLKLWLWRFRNRKSFNEALVWEIASSLGEQVRARYVEVVGHFHPRGGISVHPRAVWHEP